MEPIATPEKVKEALKKYLKIRDECLDPRDFTYRDAHGNIVESQVSGGSKHVNKSGWRKVALAFNLDWEVLSTVMIKEEDRYGKFFLFESKVRVTAPNGRSVSAIGACSSRKPFFSKKKGVDVIPLPENIAMMSQTVALNRAIADLTGSGEVSGEEIDAEWEPVETKQQARTKTGKSKPDFARTSEPAPQPSPGKDRPDEDVPTQADKDAVLKLLFDAFNKGMPKETYLNYMASITNAGTLLELRTAAKVIKDTYHV